MAGKFKLKLPEKWQSRKLWCAFIAAFVAFGNTMWDWGLTGDQVLLVISPLLAYIGVEGMADIKER